jgi:hypothetical protein
MGVAPTTIASSVELALCAAVLISANQTPQDADKTPPITKADSQGMPRSLKQI